jgi:hypothetical protein
MASPFNHILNKQTKQHQTRLPFAELCGFYAALRDGVSPAVVARASGLDVTTAGALRRAGSFHSGQLRYPKVAREFQALGEEAFIHKYVTRALINRLDDAAHGLAAPARPFTGVNERANRYEGTHTQIDKRDGRGVTFKIGFDRNPCQPGWLWSDFEQSWTWRGDPREKLDERGQERRFATSTEAWKFYQLRRFATDAQVADGSAEIANDDSYFFKAK